MEHIKAPIRERYTRLAGQPVGDDDDIFATGLVGSDAAQQIVQLIERRFNITVDGDDLDMDNFRTVNATAGFVVRKGGG